MGKKYEQIINLTEEVANEFLKNNYQLNRKINNAAVAKYARDILEGNWNEEVSLWQDPLVISEDGKLINGQHRCLAVIAAKKPIRVLVKYGCPTDFYKYFDGGVIRKPVDLMPEFKNANVMAALAKIMCAIEDGSAPLKSALQGKMDSTNKNLASRTEILNKVAKDNEYIDRLIKLGWEISTPLRNKNTAYAAALFIIDFVGKGDRIDSFAEDFGKVCSESKSNISCKAYMTQCLLNKNFNKTPVWIIGCILYAYENYYAGKDVGCYNKVSSIMSKYDKLVDEERKRRTENDNL